MWKRNANNARSEHNYFRPCLCWCQLKWKGYKNNDVFNLMFFYPVRPFSGYLELLVYDVCMSEVGFICDDALSEQDTNLIYDYL